MNMMNVNAGSDQDQNRNFNRTALDLDQKYIEEEGTFDTLNSVDREEQIIDNVISDNEFQ